MKVYAAIAGLLIVAAGVLGACSTDSSSAEPSAVTFDIEMIEIKGGTDGIAAPSVDPTTLSEGYRFKAPGAYDADNPAKWQVSTYMFSPAAMTVVQGDDVSLRIFGVNGDEHVVWVEAPDGSEVTSAQIMNRGREYNLSFTADQTGHYKVRCGNHAPTMQADILSLS